MSRGRGWRDLDHWGCWAAEHCAWLSINTALPLQTEATVFVLVCGPDPDAAVLCDVQVSDGSAVAVRARTIATWTAAAGRVAPDGTLAVRLRSAPLVRTRPDEPDHLVGLIAVGYAPAGDPLAQTAFAASVVPLSDRLTCAPSGEKPGPVSQSPRTPVDIATNFVPVGTLHAGLVY